MLVVYNAERHFQNDEFYCPGFRGSVLTLILTTIYSDNQHFVNTTSLLLSTQLRDENLFHNFLSKHLV